MRAPIGFNMAPVSPCDVRRSLRALADLPGYVVSCPCGASRFCCGRAAFEDASTFRRLHAEHAPPPEAA